MIDIRTEKPLTFGTPVLQRDNSWFGKTGAHEESGWSISLGRNSASIREPGLEWTWIVDRTDVPAAFASEPLDLTQLKLELRTAIAARMTVRALDEMLQEVRNQFQFAFWNGKRSVQEDIRKALGI